VKSPCRHAWRPYDSARRPGTIVGQRFHQKCRLRARPVESMRKNITSGIGTVASRDGCQTKPANPQFQSPRPCPDAAEALVDGASPGFLTLLATTQPLKSRPPIPSRFSCADVSATDIRNEQARAMTPQTSTTIGLSHESPPQATLYQNTNKDETPIVFRSFRRGGFFCRIASLSKARSPQRVRNG